MCPRDDLAHSVRVYKGTVGLGVVQLAVETDIVQRGQLFEGPGRPQQHHLRAHHQGELLPAEVEHERDDGLGVLGIRRVGAGERLVGLVK